MSTKNQEGSKNGSVQMVVGGRGEGSMTEQEVAESLTGEAGQWGRPHDQVHGLVVLTDGLKISAQHLFSGKQDPQKPLLYCLKFFSSGPSLYILFRRGKAPWLPGSTPSGRQCSHLPSVVIHTYPCQSSSSPSGFIKLFLPNTYSAVSEWSPSKHSLLHFTTFLSTAGIVAIWPSP